MELSGDKDRMESDGVRRGGVRWSKDRVELGGVRIGLSQMG